MAEIIIKPQVEGGGWKEVLEQKSKQPSCVSCEIFVVAQKCKNDFKQSLMDVTSLTELWLKAKSEKMKKKKIMENPYI
jgi:hypothetical protein